MDLQASIIDGPNREALFANMQDQGVNPSPRRIEFTIRSTDGRKGCVRAQIKGLRHYGDDSGQFFKVTAVIHAMRGGGQFAGELAMGLNGDEVTFFYNTRTRSSSIVGSKG